MYDNVREYILKRIAIPDEDLEKSFQYSTVRYYKKGDHVLRAGEYCRFIGFIKSGLIVRYSYSFFDIPERFKVISFYGRPHISGI